MKVLNSYDSGKNTLIPDIICLRWELPHPGSGLDGAVFRVEWQ